MHKWTVLVINSGLTGSSRAVMLALAGIADRGGSVDGSVAVMRETIASRAGVGKRTAQERLGQLVNAGYLERQWQSAGPAIYTIRPQAFEVQG